MKKRLIRALSCILVVCMVLTAAPLNGFAGLELPDFAFLQFTPAKAATVIDSGSCGATQTWTLDSDGVLTVSGTGTLYYNTVWDDYAVFVKKMVINNGITAIGSSKFNYFIALTSISLPDTLTSIGNYAFSGCTSLTSITIPDSVTLIGIEAFRDCITLTSVTFGDNVTSIGNYAFDGCVSLSSVKLPDKLISIGLAAFADTGLKEVVIPDSVQTLESNAFSSCKSLDTVVLNNTITSIGAFTFYNCEKLKAINIPDSVTSIGNGAFQNCSSLSSVSIPNYNTTIARLTFSGCTSLTSVSLPNSIQTIGVQAFEYCSALKDVWFGGTENQWNQITIDSFNIPLTNATIHFGANENTVVASGAYGNNLTWTVDSEGTLILTGTGDMKYIDGRDKWDRSIKKAIISDGITSIDDHAFFGYEELESVTLGKNIKSIGESAFDRCYSLRSINFPESLERIDNYAFVMTALEEIYIPAKLKSIGNGVFEYCMPTKITVAAGNASYSSQDGVLYNKNKTILLKYPGGNTRTSFTVPDGVKIIDALAFMHCYNLQSVIMPDSVVSIGEAVFCNGGKNLQSITLSKNLTVIPYGAFATLGLKEITLPEKITTIEEDAFWGCENLEAVTLSANVKTIKANAFDSCESLEDVYFNGTQEQWEAISIEENNDCLLNADIHFKAATTVVASGTCGAAATWKLDSDGVLTISGTGAMYDYEESPWYSYRESVYSVVIESGITTIGNYAFCYCEYIETVSMPDTLTSIGGFAFGLCMKLKSVKIPESVTAIRFGAFAGCIALTSVSLPVGITTIESAAFAMCAFLQSVQISGDNKYYQTVNGVLYNKDMTTLMCYPGGKTNTSFTIPSGVETIDLYAFSFALSLQTINIPEGVSVINEYTFYSAFNLKNVVIPASVQTIDTNAFCDCSALTTVTISKNSKLKTIRTDAFVNCSALNTVYYGASKSNWNSISVEEGNNALLNANIYYNSAAEECVHKWGSGVVTVQPTESKEGVRTYTCQNCGIKKTEAIAKLQKTWSKATQYSFSNSSTHFATGKYSILDSDLDILLNYIRQYADEEDAQQYINRVTDVVTNKSWSGSCYGMALSALLDYYGKIDMNNYDPDAATLYEVDSPRKNEKVQSAINYYYLTQYIAFLEDNYYVYYGKGNSNWTEGLISLVRHTQETQLVLFGYWFYDSASGKCPGHAIVVKGYKGVDSAGNHVLLAYDNRYPEQDVQVVVSEDYSSCTIKTPYKNEEALAIDMFMSLDDFDMVDIDGPNNDGVLNSGSQKKNTQTTDISVELNGDMTIRNKENEYIRIEGGEIESTMNIVNTRMIVSSTDDGEPDSVSLIFSVSESDYFSFTSDGDELTANVRTKDSYASITATDAYAATISTSSGVSVSGADAEYVIRQSVSGEDYDMLSVSGTSKGSTYISVEDNYAFVSGNKAGEDITFGKFASGTYEENTYETKQTNVTMKMGEENQSSDVLLGDVDGDGTVTSSDARFALRAAVNLETLTEEQFKAADADKNGEVASADARLILRAAVGLENL